jgi:hypothetical protein
MSYWKTPKELGLTEAEIEKIVEELWQKETKTNCHDCNAKPGEQHKEGCDVARCTVCGVQAIQCYEHLDAPMDTWDGLWPGTKECYELKLIAFGGGNWTFDYNTYTVMRLTKLIKE